MSSKPTLTISTPKTANFPHIPPPPHELRSATSVASATPLSAVSRTSAFRDPIPSSALPSAGLPSAGPFSALFSAGPYSAAPFSATIKLEHDLQKTPITPPLAYTDFLKGMAMVSPALGSPPQTGKSALNRTSTVSIASSNLSTSTSASSSSSETADSDDSEKDKGEQIESGPSTARSDLSCGCEDGVRVKEEEADKTKSPRPAPLDIKLSNTPRGSSNCPLSAPAAGANATVFPSMKLPASPAISTAGLYSPRSPLSAASVRSPAFDWEAALKSRRLARSPGLKRPAAPDTPTASASAPAGSNASPHKHAKKDSRSSVRHIREVVTRTVTYTPRMAPAPKGKRRKIDPEATTAAAKS